MVDSSRPGSMKEIQFDCLNVKNNYTCVQGKDYGYGLGVRAPLAGISTDFGWGGAAGAYLLVDRVNGITAYHAQHTLNSPNSAQRRALAQVITECLLGGERARSVDTAGESTLQQYQ